MIELFIVGIAAAINMIVIKLKFDAGKLFNGMVDLTIFVISIIISEGTLGGLVIATIGSLIVSIFLWYSPPRLPLGGNK